MTNAGYWGLFPSGRCAPSTRFPGIYRHLPKNGTTFFVHRASLDPSHAHLGLGYRIFTPIHEFSANAQRTQKNACTAHKVRWNGPVNGSGSDALRSGPRAVGTGADALRSGPRAVGSGADVLRRGQRAVGSSADTLRSGQRVVGSGADILRNGPRAVGSGANTLRSGPRAFGTGADTLRRGRRTLWARAQGAAAIGGTIRRG